VTTVRERFYVPSLVGIGLVVSVVSSLGAPLIPRIARSLDAGLSATQWSLTSTLLVGAVASPVVGRLGDGPHRRRVLLVCLATVTAGGVIAALAGTLAVLVAGRAMQGLGLALMPLTMASARDHLRLERAGPVIATLSVVAAVGIGLGYPVTGFIAEHLDVSAAFWFGAIASAVAFMLAVVFVPSPSDEAHASSLDARGAALIGAGLTALLIALEKGNEWGWGAPRTLGLLGLAAVLLALWTRNELRVEEPLVELRLLRRAVLTANVTGLVLGTAMYLGISLMTQYVQLPSGFGESVFVAGFTLVPLSALSSVSSRLRPALRRRAGRRAIIPVGAAAIFTGMLFFALTGDALWQASVTMGVVGLGLGLTFAAMPGLIVGSVPQHETSSAASFYRVSRYVGFSIGSGLARTRVAAAADQALGALADHHCDEVAGVGRGLDQLAAPLHWLAGRR
jgi:MFS family permease